MEAKDRILLKAHSLFLQYGVRSVSMDDIANQLGMSKKTLYQYYADKDELVHAVVDTHLCGMQEECVASTEDAKDAVHEIFLTMVRLMEQFAHMNPMLLNDLEKFHFRAFSRFREYRDGFLLQIVRKNILWGIEQELYREDLNVDILSKFRLQSMMMTFDVSLFPPGKYNLGETTAIILEHYLYGLATIKGHRLIQKYHQQRLNNQIDPKKIPL